MPPYIPSKKRLTEYFNDLMRIEDHRQVASDVRITRLYKDMLKDLQSFLGVEYANLAEDDQLTYAILTQKGQYARFMEQVQEKVDNISPKISKEITSVVNDTYKIAYEGMVNAVSKSANNAELAERLSSIKTVPATTIKAAVQNPVSGLTLSDTLEKNRKEIVYNIKQTVGVGLMNGDRMSTMAKRISEQVDKDYRKSMLIARTEVHRVREVGHNDSANDIDNTLKKANSEYRMVKVWKTMQDAKVRHKDNANHVQMNGVTVLQDEEFDLGDGVTALCPGSSGAARHDCNCRCYVSHDLMNDEEFFAATGRHFPDHEEQPKELSETEKLEKQEQDLLDEQDSLTKEQEKIQQRMQNLETYQYENIWKDPVTPKDYADKKDKIPLKRQYFNEQLKNTGDAKWQDLLDKLDDFEAQGKTYLKLSKKLSNIESKMSSIQSSLNSVRRDLMKAKGIDPKKMQGEIDDLVAKLDKLQNPTIDTDALKKLNYSFEPDETGWDYHTDSFTKDYLEHKYKNLKVKKLTGVATEEQLQKIDALEEFFDKYKKITNPSTNPKKIAKLQKELEEKQKELEKIKKRYGLSDLDGDKFSQARKDKAYWFTSDNGGAKAADKVVRSKCGDVWQKASKAQKDAIWEYTGSYHKFNEPLRGIEYGTSKYVGVGKIDLDTIGVNYAGYKKGQVRKLIDDMTNIIDKSSYDFDMWFNRGCGLSGMDKFFGINPGDFYLSESELAAKLVGTTPTEYGFMSTGIAKGKGFSGDIKLNIYAPKGTKMMYAEPFSRYGLGDERSWDGIRAQSSISSEAEMIFQRNTKFRVTKVEKSGGTWYIDMDVISQKR